MSKFVPMNSAVIGLTLKGSKSMFASKGTIVTFGANISIQLFKAKSSICHLFLWHPIGQVPMMLC